MYGVGPRYLDWYWLVRSEAGVGKAPEVPALSTSPPGTAGVPRELRFLATHESLSSERRPASFVTGPERVAFWPCAGQLRQSRERRTLSNDAPRRSLRSRLRFFGRQGSSRVQPRPVPPEGGWSVSRSTTHDLSVRRESPLNTRTHVRIRARIPRSRFRGRLQCWWLPVFVYINTAWRRPLTPARKTVGFDSPFKPYPHIGVVLLTSKSGSILLGRSSFPSLDVRGFKLDSPKCAFEFLCPRIYHRMADSNCL